MSFRVTWDNLLDNVEALPADATLLTPFSQNPFHITDVQQHRILIEHQTGNKIIQLQRKQFEIGRSSEITVILASDEMAT